MAPARLSMPLDPIYRGSTWRLPVQFLNEDQTPFDLTGAEVTAFMERNGLPRQRVEVVGNVEGSGLVTFNGDEAETTTWAAGRYGIEIRLAIADDILSVLVATIPVVKGPADGGADAVLPGAAQIGGVQGVVVSATGMIRAVIVDRVRIGGASTIDDLPGLRALLADYAERIAALESGETTPPNPSGGALNFSLPANSALIGAL